MFGAERRPFVARMHTVEHNKFVPMVSDDHKQGQWFKMFFFYKIFEHLTKECWCTFLSFWDGKPCADTDVFVNVGTKSSLRHQPCVCKRHFPSPICFLLLQAKNITLGILMQQHVPSSPHTLCGVETKCRCSIRLTKCMQPDLI